MGDRQGLPAPLLGYRTGMTLDDYASALTRAAIHHWTRRERETLHRLRELREGVLALVPG